MLRIDAHQHFWKYDAARDSWINEDMQVIRRDFEPEDLYPLLKEHAFDGSVVVQSDQSELENMFHLEFAAKYDFIKGIVGWVDLTSDDIYERINGLSHFSQLKGFRHVLQSEPQEDFMLTPAFKRGIGALDQHGFTYDLLIYPNHLPYARQLVESCPNQRYVIDHLAKPYIKERKIDQWKKDISAMASHDNVWCKASGMVTEADWNKWDQKDFRPYLDALFEAFGPQRIMFGSDWPVCLVASTYKQVVGILEEYMAGFSPDEQSAFWGGTAASFYNLK